LVILGVILVVIHPGGHHPGDHHPGGQHPGGHHSGSHHPGGHPGGSPEGAYFSSISNKINCSDIVFRK
jgi:hypothetical protein